MSEKTHKPTAKRLRDARKRGEVVFSQDITAAAVFVMVTVAAWLLGAWSLELVRALWQQATSPEMLAQPGQHAQALWQTGLHALCLGCGAITGVALLAGSAGSFFQVGGMAAWERIKPDLKRLNPANGLQRMFSSRNLVNLLKMVLKTGLLAGLLVTLIASHLETALRLGYAQPGAVLKVGAHLMLGIFGWAALIYVLMAGVDYAHQHYEFMKQQRMSIDEIRREHKDNEGDPLNMGRRRMAHFEAVYASLADRVRASSAVIHAGNQAVALQYLGETDLPRVIARGEGAIGAQILKVAGEALIPVTTDIELAPLLYAEVGQDMAISRALYKRVAVVLRWAQGAS